MKKLIISLAILTNILLAKAQHETEFSEKNHVRGNAMCDSRVQIADSVINFAFDSATEILTPVSVLIYSYDQNLNLTQVISKTLPGRTNNFRQIFEYDSNDLLTKYIYQVWINNTWTDNLINERTYTPDGLPDTEVFLRENAEGVFVAYQRHFYVQDEGRITSYLRQVKNAAGEWYDFSNHYYIYDETGRLTVLYGQYVNNGPVFWERTAIYNNQGKVSERYLRVLRYNYVLKMNVLTNELYQVYSYNMYGNVTEIRNFGYTDNAWYPTGVDSTYYSKLKNKKVRICHNGHSICVSINALDAHLAHGDKIGPCQNENTPSCPEKENADTLLMIKPGFSVYPNPATEIITIKVEKEGYSYTSGSLISSSGQIIKSFRINGESETRINVSHLIAGRYLISLTGKNGTNAQILIIE